jgi:hypothetical protein
LESERHFTNNYIDVINSYNYKTHLFYNVPRYVT